MGQAYDDRCELEENDRLIPSLKRRIRELKAIVRVLNAENISMTELKALASSLASIERMTGLERCTPAMCARCHDSHSPNMHCKDGKLGFRKVK
jgi:hypothetical protein